MGWLGERATARLWQCMKNYVNQYAYLKTDPPEVLLDQETGKLYIKDSANAYNFQLDDSKLIYKTGGNS